MSFPFHEERRLHAHCPKCGHEQVFVKVRMNHLLHLALIVITAGLWSVCWLALCIDKYLRPWCCHHCGCKSPEFGVAARLKITKRFRG